MLLPTKIEQKFLISNKNIKKRAENREKERIGVPFSVIEQNLFVFLPNKAKKTDYEYYTDSNQKPFNHQCTDVSRHNCGTELRH